MSTMKRMSIGLCCVLAFTSFSFAEQLIIFGSSRDGNREIYKTDVSGGDIVRLTNDPAIDGLSRLSPNSDKVAFVSNRSGSFQLYVMDIDGSDVTQLTTNGTYGGHNPWGWPAWSPDGMQLLYNHGGELHRINLDGSGDVVLATAPGGLGIHNMDWRAGRIVFQAQGGWGYTNDLYIMNEDGSDMHVLVANRAGGEGYPRLSLDGSRVAYHWDSSGHEEGSGRSLASRIHLINVDGTGDTCLCAGVPDNSNDFVYGWTPDGSSVFFTNSPNDNNGTNDLWTINVTTGQRTFIITDASEPDWGRIETHTSFPNPRGQLVSEFSLSQNFPNPFNPTTSIPFSVKAPGEYTISVYNATGQLVRELYHGILSVGEHRMEWNGLDGSGRTASSGSYFCEVIARDQKAVVRMLLIR